MNTFVKGITEHYCKKDVKYNTKLKMTYQEKRELSEQIKRDMEVFFANEGIIKVYGPCSVQDVKKEYKGGFKKKEKDNG
jgi:3-deoxy-D-arabino-heptulosonate 7-phosphate (DAHP) synthase